MNKFKLGADSPQTVSADGYNLSRGFITFYTGHPKNSLQNTATFPSKDLHWIFRDDQEGFENPPAAGVPGTA